MVFFTSDRLYQMLAFLQIEALHKNSKNSGINYQSCSLLTVRYWLIVSDLLNISEQLIVDSEQPEADF